MAAMIRKRVAASSLLEVIISMVVILIIFGIAMMIFTNVTGMSLSGKKLRAEALVSKMMADMAKTNQPEDAEIKSDEFTIKVSITGSQAYAGLDEIKVIASDKNGQQLAIQRLLIPKSNEAAR